MCVLNTCGSGFMFYQSNHLIGVLVFLLYAVGSGFILDQSNPWIGLCVFLLHVIVASLFHSFEFNYYAVSHTLN